MRGGQHLLGDETAANVCWYGMCFGAVPPGFAYGETCEPSRLRVVGSPAYLHQNKTDGQTVCFVLVEISGFEPLASCMPFKRSTN